MEKHDLKINEIEITIFKDDKVWGDGQHETHKHLMDLICKYGVKNRTVIDVGTGTGILSIFCGKLGAKRILAVDNDTHALEWARKNIKRNEVNVDVEVNDMTQYIDDKFDIVISNLPPTPQVENVKTIAKNMNDDGLFIMSWLNKLKFEDYVRDFEVIEHIQGVEFDAYALKRKER